MLESGSITVTRTRNATGSNLSLTNSRSRAVAKSLINQRADGPARAILSLVYGLCPIAHTVAFDSALAAARGITPDDSVVNQRAQAVRLEALLEIIRVLTQDAKTHFCAEQIDLFAKDTRFNQGLRTLGTLRAASAFLSQPIKGEQETSRQIQTLWHSATALSQSMIFDETHPNAAMTLMSLLDKTPFAFGHTLCELMPSANEMRTAQRVHTLIKAMDAQADFDLTPQIDGAAKITGPLARLINDEHDETLTRLYRSEGASTRALCLARLRELQLWCCNTPSQLPGSFPIWTYSPCDGTGVSFIETARGLLIHRVALREERVIRMNIVAPTEWHFQKNGPAQQALNALSRSNTSRWKEEARLVASGFDACVPVTILDN